MSDARDAFSNLQAVSGRGFDATALYVDLDPVSRRIARHRIGRVVVSSCATLATVGVAVLAGLAIASSEDGGPAVPPSATSSPWVSPSESPVDSSVDSSVDPRAASCRTAQVVSGKPVGNLGGLMGWFNSSPDAPCEDWPDQILDHPDTVLISTVDNTMVEAYYRTTIDSLGVYANLGDDFVVPDPDPSWPAESLVLIDASTKELLEVTALADLPDLPVLPEASMSAPGGP